MAVNTPGNERSTFERGLRWIGDLDHEFYDDERNRFVWYEASAAAFQLFLFANIALVGAMLWLGGAAAFPYAVPLFIVNVVIATVVISYAKRKYAEYTPTAGDFQTGRMRVYLGLTVFMAAGGLRAIVDANDDIDGLQLSDVAGLLTGFASGIAILAAIGFVVKRRHASRLDLDDDEF